MTIYQNLGICLITADKKCSNSKETANKKKLSCVYVFGREILITTRQSLILELLMSHPGRYFSRSEFLDAILDEGDLTERCVDATIKRLREKMFPANETARSVFIKSKYGAGYTTPLRAQATFAGVTS